MGRLLSERDYGRVSKAVRYVEGQTAPGHAPTDAYSPIPQPVSITFYNSTTETIPAGAVMRITGAQLADKIPYLSIAQPSASFGRNYAVNGDMPIEKSKFGQCYTSGWVKFAYDTGTPAVGDLWGPKSGQWTASKDSGSMLTCFGVLDATNKIALGCFVVGGLSNLCRAVAKGIISGSTGTVDAVTVMDDGQSPVAAASTELSVNNPWNFYLADDALCQLTRNGSGWDITNVAMVDQDFEVAESVTGVTFQHTWRGVRVNPIEAVQAAATWHTGTACP